MEKEAKDKVTRDKQRAFEIENINKELEKTKFTYDFKGNIIVQNSMVAEMVPADFKFKYKFKKGRRKGENNYGQKKQIIPFVDSKKTGNVNKIHL